MHRKLAPVSVLAVDVCHDHPCPIKGPAGCVGIVGAFELMDGCAAFDAADVDLMTSTNGKVFTRGADAQVECVGVGDVEWF